MNQVINLIVVRLVLYSFANSFDYPISKSVRIGNLRSLGNVSFVIAYANYQSNNIKYSSVFLGSEDRAEYLLKSNLTASIFSI